MEADYIDWLKGLKVGDEVAVRCHHGDDKIVKVARGTATQIVVEGSRRRFRRKTGYQLGDSSSIYGRPHLVKPSDEIRGDIRHNDLVYHLGKIHWRELSLETLEAVNTALGDHGNAE